MGNLDGQDLETGWVNLLIQQSYLSNIFVRYRSSSKMLNCVKPFLLNLLIASEGIMLLISGSHRQRFYQIYSQLTPAEEQNQKLGQLIIIVASLSIFTLSLSSNIVAKTIAYCLYSVYICFQYNVAKFNSPSDLAILATEMLIIGYAVLTNIDYYINQDQQKHQHQIKKQIEQRQKSRNDKVKDVHEEKMEKKKK